ncbi:hypothetical protein HV284_02610 [Escherichia marmotae]|uniref:Lhr-like DEAD/H associated domain-containing protein n=1 Tax=Escherichia marmotae TaxID=1499973 RepID=A0A7H9KDL7_9ESCH|nr:hypothetical protein [Escherichia marmotae]MBB2399442.1 hypothetical protein [Escherichia sp. 14.0993]MBB2413204.1 hypothetical protein [Escherichia sp. 11.1596]MBB2418232.1 hypothetical protein [Escherichia sp. 12.2610]MBB2422031.1 hypothetical protein [Escherichia sp. 11.1597]MBB2431397.1 hypothetical protein [Escherichia sp. 11.1600]
MALIVVPGSRHLVLERCHDEIGDWRIILHSPYGRRVHEPWAGALVVIAGGKLLLYLAQGGKKMLVWQEKDELLPPEVFHALATALRREPRLRFTLTEVNDQPVRQTPMFTLLREAGFSSSPQGLDWG